MGRSVGAVALGTVIAWALAVGLSIVVLGLYNQPAAIMAVLPGQQVPPVPLWEQVRWHPMVLFAAMTLATFVASLVGSVLLCWILRRAGRALLLLPVVGALISPGMLFSAQWGEVVGVVALVAAAILGAVVAQVLARRPARSASE